MNLYGSDVASASLQCERTHIVKVQSSFLKMKRFSSNYMNLTDWTESPMHE